MADGAIELTREGGRWVDRARAYRVFVDGGQVGKIKPGETQRYDVAAGRHDLQLRIDWCTSPTLAADVPDGAQVRLECAPNAKIYNVIWMVIAHINDYIALRPAGSRVRDGSAVQDRAP